MKTRVFITLMLLLVACDSFSAQSEALLKLETETGTLEGTLLVPLKGEDIPIAVIISGSGPTDRNGNSSTMQNNALKMLAAALQKNAVASVRFDKRGVGKSSQAAIREEDLRFEHYIQ